MIFKCFFQRLQKGWAWPLEWQKTNWSCFSALLDLLQLKAGASKHRSIFPEPFFFPHFYLFFPLPRSKWRGMRLWRRFCSMDSCARGPSTTRTSRGPAQRRGPAEGGLRWEATTPWWTWRRTCDPEKVFQNLYCCFTKIFMLHSVNMAMWTRTCDLKKSLGKNHTIVLYREILTLNTKSWEIIFSCLYRKIFAAQ